MPSLADRLSEDLKAAMRSGDTVRRDEIRGVLAALKAERQTKLEATLDKAGLIPRDETPLTPQQATEVERIRSEVALTEDDEQGVLEQRVKQHRQSIEGFTRGNRADLVAQEEAQLAALAPYLPSQVTGEELDAAIRQAIAESGAASPRDQKKVMDLLSSRLRGRADMRQVGKQVQGLLRE